MNPPLGVRGLARADQMILSSISDEDKHDEKETGE